jgi:glycine/D-amino acid oxidase-like deaminating enzyme
MPQTADAVIDAGGVMGCSILYNLAKGDGPPDASHVRLLLPGWLVRPL